MVIEYEKDYLEELYNDGKCTNKKYRLPFGVQDKTRGARACSDHLHCY